jgi:pimeloyl-ACP methyl ester carboxylesterase
MTDVTERKADATAIRPFTFEAAEADLQELRARIAATRWPEKEPVDDQSQGVQLATIQALARYWETEYDWRECEARLKALPQFVTEIDGVDVHFIHVRSEQEDALPLIVTHGWPRLDHRAAEDHRSADESNGTRRECLGRLSPRDPVAAGLRVLRQAGHDRLGPRPDRAGVGGADGPPRLHEVRGARRRLGRDGRGCDGYAGASGTARHSPHLALSRSPDIDQAVQTGSPLPSDLSADERRACEQLAFFYTHDLGYAQEMSHRPQTIYALEDSPVGLAAWLIDHDTRSYALIARVFDGQAEGLTRDDLLDNITLYWLTSTAVSSARIYWENNKYTFFAPKHVAIPVAVTAFPDEVIQTPRSWTERAYPNLIYYNKVDKGGHFAAWEQPQLFADEVRAGFRSLR